MISRAPKLEFQILIGKTPDRAQAVLGELADGDFFGVEDREDDLRRFQLSNAKRRMGKWRAPLPIRSLRAPTLSVTVPRQLYEEALSGSGEFYVWKIAREVDNGPVHQEYFNKVWFSSFRIDRTTDLVYLTAKYVYEPPILSADDLAAKEEQNPFGDYNHSHCECKGVHDRYLGWLTRAIGCSRYTYAVEQRPGWTEQRRYDGGVVQHSQTFVIERHTKDGGVQWECVCGAWTEVRLEDGGRDYMTVRVLYDSRSAEARADYLRKGIPMRWRFYVGLMSLASAPLGVLVWWWLNQCLGSPGS